MKVRLLALACLALGGSSAFAGFCYAWEAQGHCWERGNNGAYVPEAN